MKSSPAKKRKSESSPIAQAQAQRKPSARLADNRVSAINQQQLQSTMHTAAQPNSLNRISARYRFPDRPAAQDRSGLAQLESFSKEVTIKEKINPRDLNDWGEVRRKLGGIAVGGNAGSIGGNVNSSLEDLQIKKGDAMSAHQIPKRIGGSGGASDNVRPWNRDFEDGTWKTDVEDEFDKALVAASVNDKVAYNVTTTDMSGARAQEIVDSSNVNAEKQQSHHKDRIQKIPLEVTATAGGKTLAKTAECFNGLIDT